MGLADIGTHIARARVQKAAGFAPAPEVGFVRTSSIVDEMRAIDTAATSLLGDYQRNVATEAPARKAYEAWFTGTWKPFFTKNTSIAGQLGSLLDSDTLWQSTMTRRRELEGFAATYQTMVTPGGAPVPPPSAPVPGDPGPPPGTPTAAPSWWPKALPTVEVPWWVWVGGTLAVLAGGYGLYRWHKKTTETVASQRRMVIDMLPSVLGAQHPASQVAQLGRDEVIVSEGCSHCGGG